MGISEFLATPNDQSAPDSAAVTQAGNLIDNALDELDFDSAPPGYAGVVVNPATNTINLWWEGAVPANVQSRLERDSVLVVRQASHSRQELRARIVQNRAAMVDVDLAIPKQDGSGIVVTHAPGTSVSESDLASLVGVPVTAFAEEPAAPLVTRQDDAAPWSAGGMMISTAGDVCSVGFAVLSGAEGRLLSAAHCDLTGNLAWRDGAYQSFSPGGSSISVSPSVDSMLINPSGGTYGRAFAGGVYSGTTRKVAGSATNNVGDRVCTSGANSGEHCSGVVVYDDAFEARLQRLQLHSDSRLRNLRHRGRRRQRWPGLFPAVRRQSDREGNHQPRLRIGNMSGSQVPDRQVLRARPLPPSASTSVGVERPNRDDVLS